jgi:hypothetical protein
VINDKGKKPGPLWEIKKFPPDRILKPEKEDVSGKTWTYGNPNLTFRNGKKIQRKNSINIGVTWGVLMSLQYFYT